MPMTKCARASKPSSNTPNTTRTTPTIPSTHTANKSSTKPYHIPPTPPQTTSHAKKHQEFSTLHCHLQHALARTQAIYTYSHTPISHRTPDYTKHITHAYQALSHTQPTLLATAQQYDHALQQNSNKRIKQLTLLTPTRRQQPLHRT